jgi:CubicO group peptidase (beta-lactamase class C family)
MSDLGDELDTLASETGFSGVVRIDKCGRIELARAYGLAHRGFEISNGVDTRFGLASGAKGFTPLAVVGLVEEGVLELSTPARSVLGSDRQLIDDGVTIEHLLSHRSGIGDYLDEEAGFEAGDYVMPVPTTSGGDSARSDLMVRPPYPRPDSPL